MNKEKLIAIGITVGAVAILIIALVSSSIGKIETSEFGLMYDTIEKILHPETFYEGLYVGKVGFRFIKYSAVFQSMHMRRFTCLNKDEIEIRLDLSFQYRVRAENLHDITTMFRDEEGHRKIMHPVAEASIHQACSLYSTSQFQVDRGAFQEEVSTILTKRYSEIYTDVTDLQLQDIKRPKSYEYIIQDKETSREDVDVAKQEEPKYLTMSNNTYKKYLNEAKITIQKAKSQRNIILENARAMAEGIKKKYLFEAKSFSDMKNSLNLNSKEFIKFMATRAIFANKDRPIDLVIRPPHQLN